VGAMNTLAYYKCQFKHLLLPNSWDQAPGELSMLDVLVFKPRGFYYALLTGSS